MGFLHHLKILAPRISLFGLTTGLYFLLIHTHEKSQISTTVLKCAPIVSLIIFIILHGFDSLKQNKYSQRILCGLVFSCIGDALLNYDLFPYGMGAFGIAQIFYTLAFGFTPLKLQIGLVLYAVAAAFVAFIFNDLKDILLYGLPIYAILLSTMCWRSLAKLKNQINFLNAVCGIGSVLFVISDGCIAFDMFYTQIPNSTIYIMSTYYAAQFGITLSILNELKSEKSSKSKNQNKNKKKNKSN